MISIRNVSNQMILVGEKYLLPAESRVVERKLAQQLLVRHPHRLEVLAGTIEEGESFSHNEGLWEKEDPPASDTPAVVDDLTRIRGIGKRIREALDELKIRSFAGRAAADADWLAGALDGSSAAQVRSWQSQARKLQGEDA